MCTDRAEKRRTAFAAALASAVLPLCAAEETQQRIFPGATTQADADAADAAAVARQGSVGRDTSRSPERTPLIIAAAVCIAVLLLGCLLCYKRRRSSANSTKHRACPSGAAAVSRLCSPDLRAGFLDAALPHHATTIQLRELQQDLLRLRPPPAFEIMAESAWLEMVHSQQIADCDGSSYERCIQRTQDLQFWGSFTESMRMAPQPRNTRFSAHDALSLGPFDVQLKLTFYPPDTDMEPEVEMQVDSIVARGVAKGLVWGVRGCAVEGDAAYEICGVYNAKTSRIIWTQIFAGSKLRGAFSGELLELAKASSTSHAKGAALQPNALFEMSQAHEASPPDGKAAPHVQISLGHEAGGEGPRLWMLRGAYATSSHVCGACVAFGYVGSEAPTRLLRPPLPEHLDPVNKRSQQFRLEAAEFAAGKAPAHLFDAPDVTPATLLRVAAKATAEVDVPASFCGRVAADKPWHAHHDAEMDDEDEFKSMLMRDLR